LIEEVKKYCEQDVKILYNVIEKFNKFIFNNFRVNAINYPTISSLSFAFYRTIFIKDAKIPILTGDLYYFIKRLKLVVLWMFLSLSLKMFINTMLILYILTLY